MKTKNANALRALLDRIDALLEKYDPRKMRHDRIIRDIIGERAAQRPLLENAIALATRGLKSYPFNPELLRRRAMARCSIVTPEGRYPYLGDAEDDLRLILAVDPYNLSAGAELLDAMFRFSGMEDSDVARVAGQFAEKAQQLLLQLIALQIKALGYAGRHRQSDRVYEKWAKLFPKSKCLRMAKKDADEIRPPVKAAARVQKSQSR